jgi:hypothetical protein
MKPKSRLLNLLTLVLISTVMAELLSGSTTLSRISQLIPQFFLYGSAAVLIRGLVRRLGLGWRSIILLGFAFGLFIEGLVLQSIFNPHFLGLDITLGRSAGVNWIWAEYLTGLHCFWSITGAILVTEIIFSTEKQEPWVGKTGLWISGIILLLISVAFHFLFVFKISHFDAAPIYFIVCAILIAAIVFMALKMPRQTADIVGGSGPVGYSFAVITVITLAAGILWFLGMDTVLNLKGVPVWIPLFGGPLLLTLYFTLLDKWKLVNINSDIKLLAVASGLLGADLLLGYLGTAGNTIDHIGQIVIIALTLLFLIISFQKLNRRDSVATRI